MADDICYNCAAIMMIFHVILFYYAGVRGGYVCWYMRHMEMWGTCYIPGMGKKLGIWIWIKFKQDILGQ